MGKNLKKRALIINAVRKFFNLNGYLEIETPVRIPAPAPEAHIDSFKSEKWYLQSSPELCMKRVAASGYEKIFQICKCFRKDERGDRHLTELTMLEWYTKGDTYMDLMDQCRNLIKFIAKETGSKESICYNNLNINLAESWQKISVEQAFAEYSKISMDQAVLQKKFDEIMSFDIEPNLGIQKPCFIFDYPSSMAALAKLKKNNNKLAERFELYIAGIELANGFSELTDPDEQRIRFEKEMTIRDKFGKAASPMPEKFLEELGNMPETAGIALGIDRLVMLFTNSLSIDEVVAFTPEELCEL
ncbi:MAG: EF-P lysine aminoacylase EpmA [Thermodesulfobacteriota bacterium]|nr:EF-P lysine aminoacylase EpmA [Thermodesulfobacteriota bacterium]